VTSNLEGLELVVNGRAIPADRIGVVGAQGAGVNLVGVEAVRGTAGLAGKVALVEMPERGSFQAFNELRQKVNAGKPAAVLALGGYAPQRGSRPRLVGATDPAVLWLQVQDEELLKAFRAGETMNVTLRAPEPKREPVVLRNVAGLIRGSDPKLSDTYVLVSAHYDHVGVRPSGEDRVMNGANDNASGTASMIEVAASLAGTKPRRSVLFVAWFGEEVGLLGSRHYVRSPLMPLEKMVANINLEQTGRTDATEGPMGGRALVTGFDYSEVGRILIETGKTTGVTVVEDAKLVDQFFNRSDNVTFAERGIPAHTVGVALQYPDYHRPGDHWDKLDYANMEKVTKFLAAGVAAIANREQPPKWNAHNPAAEKYMKAGSQD
jgi:hypothetical protein